MAQFPKVPNVQNVRKLMASVLGHFLILAYIEGVLSGKAKNSYLQIYPENITASMQILFCRNFLSFRFNKLKGNAPRCIFKGEYILWNYSLPS